MSGQIDSEPDHSLTPTAESLPTEVEVVNPTENSEKRIELSQYKTDSNPRGLCLIINNFKFHDSKLNRDGSEKDVKDLEELFKELHFVVTVENDLAWDEMRKKAIEFAKKDHGIVFAFILMSHGGDGDVIFDKDGRKIRTEDLMSEFKAANCPALKDKPKLFFINSCRGSRSEQLTENQHMPDEIGAAFLSDSTLSRGLCPQEADFLLAFSTAPGYTAWRCSSEGSVFVQVLVKAIREHHRHHHLLDILTEVNREVVEIGKQDKKAVQIPAPTHTLRAQVYL